MEYHFRAVGKTCAATGETLEPGTKCFSVLVEEDGVLNRYDYSLAAWQGPPPQAYGHWQTVVPKPKTAAPRKIDTEALYQYFEQLQEDPNSIQQKMGYVLALLLLQKRRLKLDGSRADGEIVYLQLSGLRGEGQYEVRDLNLADEEVAALQLELNQHLQADVEE